VILEAETDAMTVRQSIYLALSALGISLTWYHNLAFAKAAGSMDMGAFVSAVFVNHASASIGWDITIGCTAFLVFLFAEAKRLGMKHAWVYVVLTCGVAFAFAAPLFLFMRDRAMAKRAAEAPTA
jgi:hypothetical protein